MATTLLLPIQRRTSSPTPADPISTQNAILSATSSQTPPLTMSVQTVTNQNTTSFQRTSQEIRIVTVTEETIKLDTRSTAASQDSYITRVMPGPLPPSPPASIVDEESVIYAEPDSFATLQTSTEPSSPPPPGPSTPPPRVHRSSTDTKASSIRAVQSTGPSTPPPSAYLPSPPSTSFAKSANHLPPDVYLQPPPARERPARRNTIGSAPKQPFPVATSGGELQEDIELYAETIRRERLSKKAKMAALTRSNEEETVTVGNIIGEGHVNYVLMYNMLTGIRIGVSRCQAKIKRLLTSDDFQAKHKYSFDIIGNELTPSAKYDFKFKDYAPWVFRSLREDHFHLDPADYLLSLTSKYILSELGSPGKSGSFFYFSRDYRFIIKTIHHAEHTYLLRILPTYYEHVKANPHTLLSRFYGLHRVKLPRGRKIHFVIMNNIFPPHRDIHETYDLKGSTVGREYPEEKAQKNPRAVLKDLNWIHRGRTLELGPEKRALLAEQLRRDAVFLKQVNVMDYSLLVGIHNMQRGNRDNVRRNTLKVFSPQIPSTSHRRKNVGHSHSLSGHHLQGSPEAIAMRRALYRTSGHVDAVELPDAADEPPPLSSTAQDSSTTEGPSSQLQHASSSQPHPASSSSVHPPVASSSSYQPHIHRRERDSHREKGKEREKDLVDHFVDRQHFMFYQDEGGLRATDERNYDMDVIYYVGVIDILTPYGGKKKLEHFWKGLSADRHKISPVPPSEYADRFLAFMKAIMRGGEGGARFKAE